MYGKSNNFVSLIRDGYLHSVSGVRCDTRDLANNRMPYHGIGKPDFSYTHTALQASWSGRIYSSNEMHELWGTLEMIQLGDVKKVEANNSDLHTVR
jgi:hypothetical protein